MIGFLKTLLAPRSPFQANRSPQWPKVRAAWLAKNPVCEVCGSRKNLEVHHMQPFHLFPKLELDPSNFATLCESDQRCHFIIGHGGNWKWFRLQCKAFIASEHTARKNMESVT